MIETIVAEWAVLRVIHGERNDDAFGSLLYFLSKTNARIVLQCCDLSEGACVEGCLQ